MGSFEEPVASEDHFMACPRAKKRGVVSHAEAHFRRDLAATAERPVNLVNQVAFAQDRKSTRLNSSHSQISYAVFCLKKKKKRSMYTTMLTTHTVRVPPFYRNTERPAVTLRIPISHITSHHNHSGEATLTIQCSAHHL